MSYLYNNTAEFKFKHFICTTLETPENFSELRLIIRSEQKSSDVKCLYCQGKVETHENLIETLKDIPFTPGVPILYEVHKHQYICKECRKTFIEELPMKQPGARITCRAACWIRGMLRHRISVATIQRLTGIHWDTIRKIHEEYMDDELNERENELKKANYKPKYLAIDEFALHKGHNYATCVMDLETGEVIWVGKGRSYKDFSRFFEDVNIDYLSEVKAVAMDMNASFNKHIEEKLPHACIVYDRFHMQAQFGKDVLGVVRLEEARAHQSKAKELQLKINDVIGQERKDLKELIRSERNLYTSIKRSRWSILMNKNQLDDISTIKLTNILESHNNLAICYAMKEEMIELFQLTDPKLAEEKWKNWFNAAKTSGIDPLVKFANLKEKRLPGLIAHSKFHISTGKLEGLNNKIKVAKRDAYGYRDEVYFFKLIRFLSIPSIRFYT